MNQFGIDYDFPGLCAICHTEIAEFEGSSEIFPGIFRPNIKSWKHNRDEIVIALDNRAISRVSVCLDCKASFTPEKSSDLMTSIIRGWQREVDDIPHWNKDKKESHMKEFSKKFISDRIDTRWNDEQVKNITKPDIKKIVDLKVGK